MNESQMRQRQRDALAAKRSGGADLSGVYTVADAVADLMDDIQSDKDRTARLTKSGKPDCNVLSEMMGEPVSAQARDIAFQSYQED